MSPGKRRTLADKVIPREQLAREIALLIDERALTQAAAARLVNDSPSQLSLLLNGTLDGFSAERLVRMLTLLGVNVEIVLRRTPATAPGKVRVRRA
jgi:predicted XRE-type DNA-binding protein